MSSTRNTPESRDEGVEVRASRDGLGYGCYSVDGRYRYWFLTETDPAGRPGDPPETSLRHLPPLDPSTFVWVGLNPSTTDDVVRRRPSLEKVLGWARRAGAARVLGVNLYAWRATRPADVARVLRQLPEDVVAGAHTPAVLGAVAGHTGPTLLAWGAKPWARHRGIDLARRLDAPVCAGRSAAGDPLHPLLLRNDQPLEPFVP